jgi:drug/metabolite transporter (DMT)-like permease
MSDHKKERTGELMILGQAFIYGLFPVILSYSGGKIPPLFFAGISTLISGVVVFMYMLYSKKTHELWNRKSYPYILKLSFFMVIGYCFMYIGGSQTSGINISILSQAEIVFTFIFAGLFFGESMPVKKLLAAAFVLLGTLMILYNGVFNSNPGDLMILAATAIFPFGNINAKRAMDIVSPQTILTIRSFISAFAFLTISAFFEPAFASLPEVFSQNWMIILLNGIVLFSLTKILWYEGLMRVDLSKAITLGMTFTAFGVLYSMMLLNEVPTLYQGLGFVVVMIGVFIITRKEKGRMSIEVLEEI